jgi:N-acylglucosamine 2-epimerase
MLEELAARCRRELDQSVTPFWLKHGLDRQCGGYFSALERDGSVYDDKKYLWLQGRHTWTFARLYNGWERRPEYLEAAKLGADFIRKFGRDREGRVYFSLTRQGAPVAYQRKPYAAVFVMLGLLEYGRAAGDAECLREAEDLFWRIVQWIDDPTLIGRQPPPPGAPKVSALANEMVLMSMAMELLAVRDDPRVRGVLAGAVRNALLHFDPERRVLVELAAPDGSSLRESPEGRLWIPGHSVEVAWFLLHALEFLPEDAAVRRTAYGAIEGSLEHGWDPEFGGLLYLMDIEGKPVLLLEHFMKLWWVQIEAIYALVLAHLQTGEDRWLTWLRKVDEYTWKLYPDPQFGEWLGYFDRQGHCTHTCKGGNYKGFFHLPRFLMMTAQRIERANAGKR